MGEAPDGPAVPPVVRLANDIARQFQHLPDDEAAAAVSAHLRSFWDPRMRSRLLEELDLDPSQVDAAVLRAVDVLRRAQGAGS